MKRFLPFLFALTLASGALGEEKLESFKLRMEPEKIYVNQKFRIMAEIVFSGVAAPEHIHISGMPDGRNGGVFISRWELKDQLRGEDLSTGKKTTRVTLQASAIATNSICINAKPAIVANMVSSLGFFSRSFTLRKFASPVQIDVLPLPEPIPEGFSGAVGKFKLSGSVNPESVVTGEVVTATLKLSGDGDVSAVVAPVFDKADPSRFKTYEQREKSRGDGEITVEQIWIPLNQAATAVGAASIICFNPYNDRYETLTAGPFDLTFRAEAEPQGERIVQVIDPVDEAPKAPAATSVLGGSIRVFAGDRLLKVEKSIQAHFAPSSSSMPLQLIPQGAEVLPVERVGEWVRVVYLNRSGWIRMK